MGLSLSIVHMLGIFSQSWITRHITHMSQAVAKKKWHILDDLFIEAMNLHLVFSKCLATGILFLWNFYGRKKIIF